MQFKENQKSVGTDPRFSESLLKTGSTANRPGIWPEELIPIFRALTEHGDAIGQTARLARDVALGRRLARAAGGNARLAAAIIGKYSYRHFGLLAVKRRPWPHSFGFWIGIVVEQTAFEWGAPLPPVPNRELGKRPERLAPI